MTTGSRPRAPGRHLAIVAACVMLAACAVPWYALGGALPSTPRMAWDGSGVLVLAAAITTLLLVTFPSPREGGPHDADRWVAYALLAGVAVVGLLVWPTSHVDEPAGLRPDRAPGLWIAIVGTAALVVAARRIAREQQRR